MPGYTYKRKAAVLRPDLLEYERYEAVYKTILAACKEQRGRPGGVADPQDGTVDVLSKEQLTDVAEGLFRQNTASGPSQCEVLPVAMTTGKTDKEAPDVPLPDPREQVLWNKVALWPANNPYQNITYRAHLEAVHRIFKDDDVSCRNMTRAFRLLSASGMKPAGAEEWAMHRMGHWPQEAIARGHVKALGIDVGPSMVALPQVLRFLACCVIQDAADGPALLYPEHAVHQLLLCSETFLRLMNENQARRASRYYERYRPCLHHELMMERRQQQLIGRRPEGARRRPPRRPEPEAESDGKSEEGPRAPRAVVLAAQQLAANRMLPAKCAAQLCPEHAAPLAATRLQAASQSATAATAPGTRDQVATVASTVAAALVAAGLDVAQAAQIAQRAAVEAGQQAWPAAAAACAVPAAPSAVPAEMLPAEVAAPDVHQRPFPSLSSLASLQQVWDLMNKGINGRPSLVGLEVASKNRWRKGRNAKETQNYNKQWETFKAFVAEVSARADKIAQETHTVRSPNRIIAQLDASREANGKPVTTYVKQIVREHRKAKAAQKAAAAAAVSAPT
eukprot:jgi/Astpho2/7603/fgenesh1_pg.00115_%23_34_t